MYLTPLVKTSTLPLSPSFWFINTAAVTSCEKHSTYTQACRFLCNMDFIKYSVEYINYFCLPLEYFGLH